MGPTRPGPVREMRETLLSAVQSGQIEELRQAFELNDLKPDLVPRQRRPSRTLEKGIG